MGAITLIPPPRSQIVLYCVRGLEERGCVEGGRNKSLGPRKTEPQVRRGSLGGPQQRASRPISWP